MINQKSVLYKIVKVLTSPKLFGIYILYYFAPIFSDKIYIYLKSKLIFGKIFNLDNPKTFNEKMNWLKLNDRNPFYSVLADKLLVKEHVAKTIGDEYVVPIIAKWSSVNSIDFSTLPEKCVLKTNQDSGGAIIFHKGTSEIEDVKKKLNRRMHLFNYYYYSREFPYKGVSKKIFAENFLDNGKEDKILNDYKFWCFNGEPKIMYITVKCDDVFENFYDMDFNPLPIMHGFKRHVPEFHRPDSFDKMKELAAKLSKGIPFVRIDFFYVQNQIYFGEFTFFDWGGFKPFMNDWDHKIGELLILPKLS